MRFVVCENRYVRRIDQHLVDHDLEDQRRDQGEDLQEERGDQHLGEHAAYFQIAPMKHEISKRRARWSSEPRRVKHQLAVPHGLELFAREQRGPRLAWRLQQDLLVIGLGDDDEVAVLQNSDRGKWRLRKTVEGVFRTLAFRLCRRATRSISVLPMVRVPS